MIWDDIDMTSKNKYNENSLIVEILQKNIRFQE